MSMHREGNMLTWDTVDLADMSFAEQLNAMRKTNVLVGVHGAGLMLVVFTAEESILLEIHPNYRQASSPSLTPPLLEQPSSPPLTPLLGIPPLPPPLTPPRISSSSQGIISYMYIFDFLIFPFLYVRIVCAEMIWRAYNIRQHQEAEVVEATTSKQTVTMTQTGASIP